MKVNEKPEDMANRPSGQRAIPLRSGRLDPANAGGQGLVGVAQHSPRQSVLELSDTFEGVVILETELVRVRWLQNACQECC